MLVLTSWTNDKATRPQIGGLPFSYGVLRYHRGVARPRIFSVRLTVLDRFFAVHPRRSGV